MSKRERVTSDDLSSPSPPILVFIGLVEEAMYQYVFYTTYDPDTWTDELLEKMQQSIPSNRLPSSGIPHFEDHGELPSNPVWTKIDQGELVQLTAKRQVARIVVAYAYE